MSDPNDHSQRLKQQALGVGIGISLASALALAMRYGFRKRPPSILPESISPAVFVTRVLPTTHGQIVYHCSGTGNPLVFLHGIYPGASSYEWSRVYPEFTNDWQVIALDLLGFGESERPSQTLNLREQAESLVEFLKTVCANRPPIIIASGVSAKLLLLIATQHPDFPKQLITWLPLGVRKALRGSSARQAMGISRLPWLRSLAWRSYLSSPAFFRTWIAKIGFAEESSEDEEAIAVLTNCAGLYHAEVAIWGYLNGSFGEDLTPKLKDIRCPTSILWPENSIRHPIIEVEAIVREIPPAYLAMLPVDGILAPLRHPTLFRDQIQEALHPQKVNMPTEATP